MRREDLIAVADYVMETVAWGVVCFMVGWAVVSISVVVVRESLHTRRVRRSEELKTEWFRRGVEAGVQKAAREQD